MIPWQLALLVWPLIGIAIVGVAGAVRGVTISILAGLMLLPEGAGFDFPLLPPISKYEIVALSATLGLALASPGRIARARLGTGPDLLVAGVLATAFATAYFNRDPLPNAPALSMYDGLAMGIRDLLFVGLPFLLGRTVHRSPAELITLQRTWLLVAIVASAFALLEVRLTPFLHKLVYGYLARNVAQEFRWGGARPMMMFPNGLALSMFFSLSLICAASLSQTRLRQIHLAGTAYLSVLLVLCRSFASLVYGLSCAAATIFLRIRTQMLVAAVLTGIGVAYPIARAAGWVTGKSVVELASVVSAERAQSFDFRLMNEDAMIDFAAERPWFGYGVFSNRNRFYNELTRQPVITDGYWTILMTGRGFVGLALTFSVLVVPVIRAWRRFGRYPQLAERAAIAGVTLMLGVQVVDLLPNGLFTFLPYYVAGALWGGCTSGSRVPSAAPIASHDPASAPLPDAPPRRRALASLTRGRRKP